MADRLASELKCYNVTRKIYSFFLILPVIFYCSCNQSKPPATKRYSFTGRVVSVDSRSQTALVDGDLVQGYMEAMAMTYKFKPPSTLRNLTPGDSISADLVVVDHDPRDESTDEESWLENVKITGREKASSATSPTSFHMPSAGEDVPDFAFTNQDGKHISLRQYRGKTLLVTFIYTRCPFPDFCPRMSGNFAEIYKQADANPQLAALHLLSISFDPEHDTPKVLRDYGFSVAHMHSAQLFRRWEFAAPRAADLPKIAEFFALTVKPEGGMITHNLSTAVIGPDGKIVSWYHGGDWQVADVVKDAASVSVAASIHH